MPIFDFVCQKCEHKQEHFVFSVKSYDLICPECGSDEYKRQLSVPKTDVEYANPQENFDKKIKPHIKDTYAAIGKEALSDSTKTADNIFGSNKVEGALDG